ncbi:MAG: DedA family protein, partial [Alphaproteobacteria bacterium]
MDSLFQLLHQFVAWLVDFVHHLGYLGIFLMTFVESTFVPIPAEVTMIPAGYLVQQGKMSLIPVLLASIFGTVGGAYFNYWLAKRYGRDLFIRYGKYLMMTPEKLDKLELFFHRHGAISTFTGRLIPGVRHYISFPAGLAKMDLKKFVIYTALGGAIWMTVLVLLGYYIGENEELMMRYLPKAKVGMLVLIVAAAALYIWHH